MNVCAIGIVAMTRLFKARSRLPLSAVILHGIVRVMGVYGSYSRTNASNKVHQCWHPE